ncbi:lipoprotein BA_5634 family protein [Brevibacillus fortis]|uniref:lipoprotein BA_5634 family protein n=1 Tax=Brevibacillus fortis TaxID=2126352 RepID=UPI002E1F19C0|nr:lipoprotein BA_5634 family protein [Brevibacillus fortis]
MKKIISFLLVIVIFAGIGFGVKRYVEGPSQAVDGVLVIGTEKDANKVKELYRDNTKQAIDYKVKLVTTKKITKLTEQVQKETGQEFETRDIKYSVITRSTAEQFIKNGILRARQDPDSASIISDPVTSMKELSNGHNLFYSSNNADMNNDQIDLNGQMVPVEYVKHQVWIGYIPQADLVIVDDQTYNQLTEAESTLSLIQFENRSFDYKKKDMVNQVLQEIGNVYADSADKVNFVKVQD